MRKLTYVFGTLLLLAMNSIFVLAQDKPGRYTMTPSDQGFVRLDTETGDVSVCSKKDDALSCRPSDDQQKGLRAENDRLIAENKGLKDEVRRLEETMGIGPPKPGDETAPKPKVELPSEEDVDKAFDYFERMVRKFQERLKQLETPKPESAPL